MECDLGHAVGANTDQPLPWHDLIRVTAVYCKNSPGSMNASRGSQGSETLSKKKKTQVDGVTYRKLPLTCGGLRIYIRQHSF